MVAVRERETELDSVIQWRVNWLLSGGFSKRNANLIANQPTIDWRYANQILANCKLKGYDEDFVMKLIL